MEIKVEEIRENDEIIYACNADLRKVRVVRPPRKYVNKDGSVKYGSTLCEYKTFERTVQAYWNPARTYTRHVHFLDELEDPSEEAVINQIRVDFNYRKGWLLKREEL